MARGDVISALTSVASAGYLTIQPGAGVEWVIHNIYHEYDITVELYDGTNSLVFTTEQGAGAMAYYAFHLNNTRYLRVKNTHASLAKLIGYDGIVTSA
jgi:hypothetical protein